MTLELLSLFLQVLVSGFQIRLKDLCNSSRLAEYVTIHNEEVAKFSQTIICALPEDKLNLLEHEFRSNIDLLKPITVSKRKEWHVHTGVQQWNFKVDLNSKGFLFKCILCIKVKNAPLPALPTLPLT